MGAILTNAYNHYLTTYAPKSTSPYDTHKRSELRSVYNSIIKLNKEAPWYLPDSRKETPEYAVSLKENACFLKNTIASLGGLDRDSLLHKQVAYSDNPSIAQAVFVGNLSDGEKESIPPIELEVKSLASGQENLGLFLPDGKNKLTPDTYSFDISIKGINYEFQFNIKEDESNRSVQERLVRLINNAKIGLSADIQESDGNSALHLYSTSTGATFHKDSMFSVSDKQTSKKSGAVSYFGLDYIAKQPSNAVFILNGEERSASSNNFTLGKLYEVTLNGVSPEGEVTTIGLKDDLESLTDNVTKLVNGYNSFINAVQAYAELYPRSSQLTSEMGSITSLYKNELDAIGLSLQEDNSIKADMNLLRQSASDENAEKDFAAIQNLAHSLVRKTAQISLNPMQYVDRTIVAYKNPGRAFASPYTNSTYSGMLFNSYC